jgi:hypothetical protein
MQSPTYKPAFERMLERVALAATDPDVPLVPFWPLRGAKYDGALLVIGRSVNGWVDDWTARRLADPVTRRAAVEWLRTDAEPADRCRMLWVTDLWGAKSGYSTARSAFWRVLRRIVLSDPAVVPDEDQWSSHLVWTNLYKVSPGAGWNPVADLQRTQRHDAIELLKRFGRDPRSTGTSRPPSCSITTLRVLDGVRRQVRANEVGHLERRGREGC